MVSALVIKVKHGDVQRRFSLHVDENGFLNIDIDQLSARILNLFKFSPDEDLILDYIDEDGDSIRLADEDDLVDAIHQGLNPMRITVQLKNKKPRRSKKRSTTNFLRPPRTQGCFSSFSDNLLEYLRKLEGPNPDALSISKDDFKTCTQNQASEGGRKMSEGTETSKPIPYDIDLKKSEGFKNSETTGISLGVSNNDEFKSQTSIANQRDLDVSEDHSTNGQIKKDRMPVEEENNQDNSVISVGSDHSTGEIFLMKSASRNDHKTEFQQPSTGLQSHLVQHVNAEDGARMKPTTTFTKIWRMRNNGTIIWPEGTQLVWIGGDQLSNLVSIQVNPHGSIYLNNKVDVAIDLKSPEKPGRYVSYWRMALPSGYQFGEVVWVDIQVICSPHDSKWKLPFKTDDKIFKSNRSSRPDLSGTAIFEESREKEAIHEIQNYQTQIDKKHNVQDQEKGDKVCDVYIDTDIGSVDAKFLDELAARLKFHEKRRKKAYDINVEMITNNYMKRLSHSKVLQKGGSVYSW